jgi:hypothetical protein
MPVMKRDKKAEKERLKEFFTETDKTLSEAGVQSAAEDPEQVESGANETKEKILPLPYACPACHRLLASRKKPCKHCGYAGYIPMSDAEIKRIRTILFVVLFIVALAVYFLTRD